MNPAATTLFWARIDAIEFLKSIEELKKYPDLISMNNAIKFPDEAQKLIKKVTDGA